ncbi:hypothetical protein sS8_5366 [Methylocaldum marinum]|uniref:Uncharacterized protein n=1 Tax=Methylocaldum marinum TaxID=1432792 RepID=A0A250L071_9GAMM|nr:hypothetical protein sS8_5366 [Methylocaldum marinum]
MVRPIGTRERRLRLCTGNVRSDWVGVRVIRIGLYFLYAQYVEFDLQEDSLVTEIHEEIYRQE